MSQITPMDIAVTLSNYTANDITLKWRNIDIKTLAIQKQFSKFYHCCSTNTFKKQTQNNYYHSKHLDLIKSKIIAK